MTKDRQQTMKRSANMNTSYEGQLRTEAYKDGIRAKQNGLMLDDNPYPRKTDEYICWELGWEIEHDKHDQVFKNK